MEIDINGILLMYEDGRTAVREKVLRTAQNHIDQSGRAYVASIATETNFGRQPVASILMHAAKRQAWKRMVDERGPYYEPLNSNGYETGSPANGALITAGVLDLPGELSGEVVTIVAGMKTEPQKKPGRSFTTVTAYAELRHMRITYVPTSQQMFTEAEEFFREAAHSLARSYSGLKVNFNNEAAMESGLKTLEHSLDRWRERFGDHLMYADEGSDHFGVGAVGEDYIAKGYMITKDEAAGAIRAMMKNNPNRVLLSNDPTPFNKLVIIDCRPPLPDADPLFNFRLHIPRVTQSTTKKLTTELAAAL